jgi:glycosyltransferase involved in cell wall biosynthesis
MRAVHDAGARFFGHAHGYDVSMQLRNPRCRADYLGYNAAAGVITMSQISKAALVEVGVSAAKISVIPYGVDVPPKRVKRGAVGDTVRCLAVGRMVAKKAPIMTLDAIRRACDTYPALTFDYVGDGELMPAAQQFVRAFHLENRVTLHGGQSSKVVDRLMTDADVFVQHSMTDPLTGDEEGLPVAILEAMAHGLPVVSTKHSGIPEAVTHGETGFLVDEGDSAAMGACVAKLASDPGLRTRMGENGWLRAKKDFSWDRERTDLLKVLGLDDPWT